MIFPASFLTRYLLPISTRPGRIAVLPARWYDRLLWYVVIAGAPTGIALVVLMSSLGMSPLTRLTLRATQASILVALFGFAISVHLRRSRWALLHQQGARALPRVRPRLLRAASDPVARSADRPQPRLRGLCEQPRHKCAALCAAGPRPLLHPGASGRSRRAHPRFANPHLVLPQSSPSRRASP